MRVVGLDLSLTSTGVSDGAVHRVFKTAPDRTLEARLDLILCDVRRFVTGKALRLPEADLVVIEAGAFSRGAQSQAAETLSGLRLMVSHSLWMAGLPFTLVPPTTLKKYVTGDGRVTKQAVLASLCARYRAAASLEGVKAAHGLYDMADALALAAMGYAHVGFPLDTYPDAPAVYSQSLDAVTWPNLLSDN